LIRRYWFENSITTSLSLIPHYSVLNELTQKEIISIISPLIIHLKDKGVIASVGTAQGVNFLRFSAF